MKFLNITMWDVAKTAEIGAASDKIAANPPPRAGEVLASYVCLSPPFPGVPPNTMVAFSITGSVEAIAAGTYPLSLAGGTTYRTPILEVPMGTSVEAERKYGR